jgi:hypothetical protein
MKTMRNIINKVRLLALVWLFSASLAAASNLSFNGTCSYQINGNQIEIDAARIENNDYYGNTSGSLRLQVWATSSPYYGGQIYGYVLGTRNLDEQLGGNQYYYGISGSVPFNEPPSGDYYITMTLEEYNYGSFVIRDYVTFDNTKSFGGGQVEFDGTVSWKLNGTRVHFAADKISNNGSSGISGSLRMKLWATTDTYDGGSLNGYVLGTKNFNQLNAGYYYPNVSADVTYTPPPAGTYYTTMTLEEYQSSGWVIVDYVTFDSPSTLGRGVGGSMGGDGGDLELIGKASYSISRSTVLLTASQIMNRRYDGVSGALRLELWATTEPWSGQDQIDGYQVASYDLNPLAAGYYYYNVKVKTPYNRAPRGSYYMTLVLSEYDSGDYYTVDYISFPKMASLK